MCTRSKKKSIDFQRRVYGHVTRTLETKCWGLGVAPAAGNEYKVIVPITFPDPAPETVALRGRDIPVVVLLRRSIITLTEIGLIEIAPC
jgi:hypothetical protein